MKHEQKMIQMIVMCVCMLFIWCVIWQHEQKQNWKNLLYENHMDWSKTAQLQNKAATASTIATQRAN